MWNRRSIGNRIAMIIGLVEIVAMMLLFLVMNRSLTNILEVKAIHDMNVIAHDRAQIVETYIADCVDFLNGYAKASENREVLEHPEDPSFIQASREYTNLYAEGYTDIEGLYVAQWDTYVLAHTNPDSVDQTFRDAESARALEEMIRLEGKPFCTGIVQAPVTKKMVIPVYAPINNKAGEPIGFAGAAFYSDMLVDTLNAVNDEKMPGVGYSLINVATGVYIFDDDPSLAGTECRDRELLNHASGLRSGNADSNSFSYSYGDKVMCCYYMPDRDWVFVVRDTKADIFGVINTVRIWLVIICLVITVLMVVICMVSVNRADEAYGGDQQSDRAA
ncbi:MAG: cache domain-containing protein [Lachnospiraceae bacterium]|nr:cache domain-containing protein [Lachnospiraceae bacterium]